MLLEQRLKLVAYWKSEKHRDAVANAKVDAPLFVVGLYVMTSSCPDLAIG